MYNKNLLFPLPIMALILKKRHLVKVALFIFMLMPCCLKGQIELPRLISDGMVLQRDAEVNIWGWASSKEKIALSFFNKKYNTQADESGNWKITLPPQPTGGPYEIKLKGKNEQIIKDVFFGDVWICAGQSNMVLTMERLKEKYPDDIKNANFPEIRNYFIKTSTNLSEPQKNLNDGSWVSVNPETVLGVSGVAYFFARDIYQKYKVPIGIINASVGGTPIEAWISEEGLQAFPDLLNKLETNKDTTAINQLVDQQNRNFIRRPSADQGLLATPKWYEPSYQPKNWGKLHIPGYWEDQGLKALNGVVWYRKTIEVPHKMIGVPAKLFMGRIVDADVAYINGKKVGNITYQYPPRRYNVPASLLKAGKNVITLRVTNYSGKGGFVPDKSYVLAANGDSLDLRGDWQYKIGDVFEPQKPIPRFSFQNQPSALYNAMVAPLIQYTARGFVWNQGESNTHNPGLYAQLLPALIEDWRQKWGQGDLPFLYVQLANFMDRDMLPVESNWADLREAQRQALKVPNTAMACAIDLGEWNDIHPLNKRDVGLRLAKAARNLSYKEKNLIYSGPNYLSHTIQNNKIILSFEHIGSGLTSIDGEPLQQFAIAGFDKKYVWAEAQIAGDKIEVWNKDIPHPMYVRYAWANNPHGANLYNREGLPASPFQTNLPKEETMLWYGKEAAVVLTYDDALNVHLDYAIPALDKHNLKASFYLSGFFPGSKNRIDDWRTAAHNGHELGNHTLYHPCDASLPGRGWVKPENDLSKYTNTSILNEIRMTNVFLEAIDGKKERTFAYTCGDTQTGEGSFMSVIANDFVASRGTRKRLNVIGNINLQNIDCYVVNGQTGEQLIQWVKEAQEKNALVTILFHGVGGEHSLNVSIEAHNQLLDYLQYHSHEIWTTTMIEAAKHINQQQK